MNLTYVSNPWSVGSCRSPLWKEKFAKTDVWFVDVVRALIS